MARDREDVDPEPPGCRGEYAEDEVGLCYRGGPPAPFGMEIRNHHPAAGNLGFARIDVSRPGPVSMGIPLGTMVGSSLPESRGDRLRHWLAPGHLQLLSRLSLPPEPR